MRKTPFVGGRYRLSGNFVGPYIVSRTSGPLLAVYVKGDLRKRTALVNDRRDVPRQVEVARAAGCGRIELTSNDRREGAHAFYEKVGYEGTSRKFVKKF